VRVTHRATWDFVGRNVASIIALCALGFTASQSYVTRRHNKLSLRPHLCSFTERITGPVSRIKYSLVNNGLGPAVIDSYTVTLDGATLNTNSSAQFEPILANLLGRKPQSFSIGHLARDTSIRKDETRLLFEVCFPALTPTDVEGIEHRLSRVQAVVKYHSVYDEPLTFDSMAEG
jgi:hypothetical protein